MLMAVVSEGPKKVQADSNMLQSNNILKPNVNDIKCELPSQHSSDNVSVYAQSRLTSAYQKQMSRLQENSMDK